MATKAATKTKTKDTEKPEAGAARRRGDRQPAARPVRCRRQEVIKAAKKRGYVTYDELNAVLPSEEVTSEQIEDIMAMFSDMGINVVDEDEAKRPSPNAGGRIDRSSPSSTGTAVASKSNTREGSDRTDDPVRMYLREMGSVELL